jgi:hypothetical protein
MNPARAMRTDLSTVALIWFSIHEPEQSERKIGGVNLTFDFSSPHKDDGLRSREVNVVVYVRRR